MIRNLLEPFISEKFKTDAHYREGHLRILNALPNREVLGLHSPEMKTIAKRLAAKGLTPQESIKNNKMSGLELIEAFETANPQGLCYEETAVWGFMINFIKCPVERKFEMLEKYVPVMDNWGICDSYVAHAKWMKKASPDELFSWIEKRYKSSREFEVRFAVVVSMCYLLDTKLDKVFKSLDSINFTTINSEYISVKKRPAEIQSGCVLGPKPYYVRMAVAWLLATALAKHPDETRSYVRNCNLPRDVLKLYTRKARESFRTRNISPF